MQEEYNTIEPTYFDDAMGFNAFADDETDAGQPSGMACIQIVHFDEVDKPVRTETVPISAFLQSAV
ncbi:MAG: hypothetical protein ISP39_04150 [Alphaproteobacteria bacterium]|jgi:hypothetical protein|nr:hypothetical protein [Rhodospirillaceae bacterium]MBL6625115.1 hypothetical protein [Alphaproteobacteria bacterium]MBL6671789.1 hypothetical protein [Alphaproteobacteria bacterium]HAO56978.1 hypothetical protein [Alphaproteobacteria bacterium]HBD52978.1 hypothetical protein [Alphaproteobacteria bacterium]